jgi:hypothetical protein
MPEPGSADRRIPPGFRGKPRRNGLGHRTNPNWYHRWIAGTTANLPSIAANPDLGKGTGARAAASPRYIHTRSGGCGGGAAGPGHDQPAVFDEIAAGNQHPAVCKERYGPPLGRTSFAQLVSATDYESMMCPFQPLGVITG